MKNIILAGFGILIAATVIACTTVCPIVNHVPGVNVPGCPTPVPTYVVPALRK